MKKDKTFLTLIMVQEDFNYNPSILFVVSKYNKRNQKTSKEESSRRKITLTYLLPLDGKLCIFVNFFSQYISYQLKNM